ncbi:hypothetical protein SRB5_65850 [Streptomyces sp. RB5]|uniref:Uncharacterized protein n=1 Tax=Streptomyces smaragdinus TaxID=2585196 RepID=A0A7K0CSA7_9ACTN|nr:hypothetical protein [Streptomyces smaragdinus]
MPRASELRISCMDVSLRTTRTHRTAAAISSTSASIIVPAASPNSSGSSAPLYCRAAIWSMIRSATNTIHQALSRPRLDNWKFPSSVGGVLHCQMSLAIFLGITKLANGMNHAPIVQPDPIRSGPLRKDAAFRWARWNQMTNTTPVAISATIWNTPDSAYSASAWSNSLSSAV